MRCVRNFILCGALAAMLAGCQTTGNSTGGFGFSERMKFVRAVSPENSDYAKAIQAFNNMKISVTEFVNSEPSLARRLCLTLYEVRDYGRFLECYRAHQSLKKEDTGTYHQMDVDILYGRYLIDIGEYQNAYDIIYPISEIPTGIFSHLTKKAAIIQLPALYRLLGEQDKATKLALEIESDLNSISLLSGQKSSDWVIRTTNARMAIARNDYEKAYTYLSEGYQVGLGSVLEVLGTLTLTNTLEDSLGYNDRKKMNFIYLYAYTAFKTGRYADAKDKYAELVKHEYFKSLKSIHYIAYYHLGHIALHEKKPEQAIKYFKYAIDIIESERSTINTEAARIGFVGDKQAVYKDLVASLIKSGSYAEAFEYAERAKARALIDLLASKKTFNAGRSTAQVNEMLSALRDAEMNSIVAVSAGTKNSANRGISSNQNIEKILSAAPETASLVSVTTMKVADIQAMLKRDEAILEYFYQGDGGVFAFVVSRDGINAFTIDSKGLDADVQRFRSAINAYQTNDWEEWSGKLYNRLIQPVANAIKGKKHLTIVPHGALHYLPFNALKNNHGTMLIEQHSLRLLPSASVMKFLHKPSKTTENLLVFGNPDRTDAPALPGAEAEARTIAALWGKSRVILRGNATETLIKQSAASFRYIHLASHGQFNPANPMQSRMLLSVDKDNDGDLMVSEIYDLNLNADLVTLSACQTGLGDVKNGDDVVGLNRGFLYAGASSILASLWEVPDNATRDLMTDFYKNLKIMDMRSAIQKAQLSTYKKYKHPIAWAAFQMTGGV